MLLLLCQPGKPGNVGGIVASVIVVMLLIGSLVGVLIYYLRNRQAFSAAPPPAARGGFTNDTYQPDDTVRHIIQSIDLLINDDLSCSVS